MDKRVVWSSHIDRIGYEVGTQELQVDYSNGTMAVYEGVKPERWQRINNSESIGAAIHELVRGRHPHRYVE